MGRNTRSVQLLGPAPQPALPLWLRIPACAAIFAAVGPLAGLLGFFLMPPFMLLLIFVAPFMPMFVPMAYAIGWLPATLTGIFAALMSPLIPASRPRLYYLTCAAVGGAISSISSLFLMRDSYDDAANQVFHVGFFISGFVGTLVCIGITNMWPLRRAPYNPPSPALPG